VIYKENVLFCNLLNVYNKNDQFKVNGHNCASLSISPIYFIENHVFTKTFLKSVLQFNSLRKSHQHVYGAIL